jgi:predicted amidophosphoribosyltransferase
MRDACLDLLLGSTCSVCGSPGRALCPRCRAALPRSPRTRWPTPCPPGLVPPVAAGHYATPLRELVLDHKERSRLELAAPLGDLLAGAVAAAARSVAGAGGDARVLLVPVPSHPAVVRARGHDPLLRVARRAARTLRRRGCRARVRRLLRVAARPDDQAGLSAAERAANLEGRFALRRGPALGLRPDGCLPLLVLVDDVITTGATLREAQRVLERAGLPPVASAVVAATRRRGRRDPSDASDTVDPAPRLPVLGPGG